MPYTSCHLHCQWLEFIFTPSKKRRQGPWEMGWHLLETVIISILVSKLIIGGYRYVFNILPLQKNVSDEWNVNYKNILLWTVQKGWMRFYPHLGLLTATILFLWVTVRIPPLRHFMVAMMCLTTKPPLHKDILLISVVISCAEFYSKKDFEKWWQYLRSKIWTHHRSNLYTLYYLSRYIYSICNLR